MSGRRQATGPAIWPAFGRYVPQPLCCWLPGKVCHTWSPPSESCRAALRWRASNAGVAQRLKRGRPGMKLPPTVRPSLVRIITLRLAITSIAAILLQLTMVVGRAYFNEDDLNRSYVTREARAVAAAVAPSPRAPYLFVREHSTPRQYRGEHNAVYAFRVLLEDGTVLAQHNGAMLAQLSPWHARPSRTQDLWLVDL